LLVALYERVRDRAAAAQVAEAERVVAIDEYAAIFARCSHTPSLPPNLPWPFIVGSNPGTGKAGLARAAGAPAGARGQRPAARPGQLEQLARQARRQRLFLLVIHRVNPLHARLAELA